MGNKKSKQNRPEKLNNTKILQDNGTNKPEVNNKKGFNIKKHIFFPKFNLIKKFATHGSIFYCFELLDGRLYLCICGDSFDIYNINDFVKPKKELEINPGVYTVSSIQAHTGNIVVCTYVRDMKVFSIDNNEVKEIQTISPEGYRVCL